ncbi:MAG: hypothetical protein CMO81_10210 [Waddliaceae bacterium]|nr:hypothetical protein [Waddliaceae bacterium]
MKSSTNKIIRDSRVEGVVFCSPGGQIEREDTTKKRDAESLKALEDFWYHKGLQEGKKQGFDEGLAEGLSDGYRKGQAEGKELGDKEGFERGKSEGLNEGRAEKEAELREAIDKVLKLADSFVIKIEEVMDEAKPEILRYCSALCEQVIGRELENPQLLAEIVTKLVKKTQTVVRSEPLTVFLPSVDFIVVHDAITKRIEEASIKAQLEIIEDEHMGPGRCLIQSSMGAFSFDVNRQIQELERLAFEVKEEDKTEDQN